MTHSATPLAITMGDPSGIGPEITIKAMLENDFASRSVVFGCPHVMERAAKTVKAEVKIRCINKAEDASFAANTIEVLRTSSLETPPPIGEVSSVSDQAAFDAIKKSIECALSGEISGIVTAPIHKEALSVAGVKYPGHTEMLADFGRADKVAMLLGNDEIRTVLVTIHCSLSDAIKGADYNAQLDAIRLAHEGAIALGYDNPCIAVAGLNPHAGEGGCSGKKR